MWRRQVDAGEIRNQAEIARREGMTRARVTQVMGVLRLAPEIRNQILYMPNVACRPPISERMLRSIEAKPHHREQIRKYLKILA